jgi:hypothetical protein
VAKIAETADLYLQSPQVAAAVERTIKSPAEWANKALSPIAVKFDYVEEGIVKTAGLCLAKSASVAEFRQCVAESPVNDVYIHSLRWAHYPPSLFSESGVRELPFEIDADLDFLRFDNKSHPTWPFKFMVQVTFESPRHFAKDPDNTFDEDPFEYPLLQESIDRDIVKGMAVARDKDFDAPRTFTDMREFTMLQRFFRLALDGKLGDRFPVEALLKLKDVKPVTPPPVVRTPVWNNPQHTYAWLKANGLTQLAAPLGVESDLRAQESQPPGCPVILP